MDHSFTSLSVIGFCEMRSSKGGKTESETEKEDKNMMKEEVANSRMNGREKVKMRMEGEGRKKMALLKNKMSKPDTESRAKLSQASSVFDQLVNNSKRKKEQNHFLLFLLFSPFLPHSLVSLASSCASSCFFTCESKFYV